MKVIYRKYFQVTVHKESNSHANHRQFLKNKQRITYIVKINNTNVIYLFLFYTFFNHIGIVYKLIVPLNL